MICVGEINLVAPIEEWGLFFLIEPTGAGFCNMLKLST